MENDKEHTEYMKKVKKLGKIALATGVLIGGAERVYEIFQTNPTIIQAENNTGMIDPEIARDYIFHNLLGYMEGAKKDTASKVDGLSMGWLQNNARAGTLMEFTQKFFKQYPEQTAKIFNDNWRNQIENIFKRPLAQQEKWFKKNYKSVKPLFQKMYKSPEGTNMQLEEVDNRFQHAFKIIGKYELETAWATAVAFNCAVHLGKAGTANMFSVLGNVNRKEIDADSVFKNYMEPKLRETFSNRKDLNEFIEYKREWFAALPQSAKIDQYMMGLVSDNIKTKYKWDRPHKRVNAILCLDAQKSPNGTWTNGGIVHKNKFFGVDDKILSQNHPRPLLLARTAAPNSNLAKMTELDK